MRTHWFVAKTKPNRERYAATNVLRMPQTLKVWMPVIEGKGGREQIIFPNYLFICTYGQWRYLENVYGMSKVICFGEQPGILPHKVIRALMGEVKAENEKRRVRYKYDKDQPVDIVSGTYAGISGMYRGTTPEKRICIVMSFMGKMVPIVQDAENVRAKQAA